MREHDEKQNLSLDADAGLHSAGGTAVRSGSFDLPGRFCPKGRKPAGEHLNKGDRRGKAGAGRPAVFCVRRTADRMCDYGH